MIFMPPIEVPNAMTRERRSRGGDHLPLIEKFICFAIIHVAADILNEFRHQIPERKSDGEGKHESEEHFRPLRAVDAAQISVHGDGGTGESRDERVAFARGDSDRPGEHRRG